MSLLKVKLLDWLKVTVKSLKFKKIYPAMNLRK